MPVQGLKGILPRFTACRNIEDSAEIIWSANRGHFLTDAFVARVIKVRLGDSCERHIEFRPQVIEGLKVILASRLCELGPFRIAAFNVAGIVSPLLEWTIDVSVCVPVDEAAQGFD
jgi:hypothetical protein